ncbi:unnamed protein product, partial [Oppiella nova]
HKEFKELSKDLSQFAIKGSEDDWDSALKGTAKTLISIKTLAKRGYISGQPLNEHNQPLVLPNGYVYGEQSLRAILGK